MGRRKLNKQQTTRVRQRQQDRIRRSKQDSSIDDDAILGPEQAGIVVARYSRNADILPLPVSSLDSINCHIRANIDSLTVGDHIIWRTVNDNEAVIVAVEERKSVIDRPDGLGKLKPVAANIDQVFIVIACEPEPHPTLIDRYLVAAEHAGLKAIIVNNKTDLPTPEAVTKLVKTYQNLSYPVIEVSGKTGAGLASMEALLHGKTSIFAGQSGVGKSSLINRLLPESEARTGKLSSHVTKGKHTTTTARLYVLPEGGLVIDSPGIREFHLNHFLPEDVYHGFVELRDCLGHCQFRDCQHQHEPGCAVRAFIEQGGMAKSRSDSLQYILNSL